MDDIPGQHPHGLLPTSRNVFIPSPVIAFIELDKKMIAHLKFIKNKFNHNEKTNSHTVGPYHRFESLSANFPAHNPAHVSLSEL